MNKVEGLCGNFDGMSENGELIKQTQDVATGVLDFAKSWTVDTTCDETASAEPTGGPCEVCLIHPLSL